MFKCLFLGKQQNVQPFQRVVQPSQQYDPTPVSSNQRVKMSNQRNCQVSIPRQLLLPAKTSKHVQISISPATSKLFKRVIPHQTAKCLVLTTRLDPVFFGGLLAAADSNWRRADDLWGETPSCNCLGRVRTCKMCLGSGESQSKPG